MRQYFYLVVVNYDEATTPLKVFLQEHEAIRWGKRNAANFTNYTISLYKQEITRTGVLRFVKDLKSYK